ncbi:kinase-like protein [Aureobasidium namibiae CBS 147.97]|uniref:Kinase-like protein n=1 Tax=Aureobasidium namibiae CBS 147.97 TaxID=1043004 RepID=A0A074X2R5_9PEZI
MAQTTHASINGIGEYLAHGATGIVERQEEVVLKRPYPNNDDSLQELEIEARIYRHLGPHPRIVPFLSWDSEPPILRIEHMKKGNLNSYITSHQCSIEEKNRWVKQAADAIEFLHSKGVIHCDIKPDNLLLDDNLDLKVCDFAGSSLQGSKALVGSATRYWRPTPLRAPCDARDDIFGLGSTIYMIVTGTEPFEKLESDEVEARFSAAKFPDTGDLLFGEVMQACWGGHRSIEEVCDLIEKGTREMQKLD